MVSPAVVTALLTDNGPSGTLSLLPRHPCPDLPYDQTCS
jgi:hypothetical protein